MTICNMSIEAGARAGMIAPDDLTYNYLIDKPMAPKEKNWELALKWWKNHYLRMTVQSLILFLK